MTAEVLDRKGLLASPERLRDVKLELGCGPRRRYPDSIAIDSLAFDGVDIVGDALDVLRLLPEGCASLVTSSHFLEHVSDLEAIVREMTRVTRAGGTIEVVVPHFTNPYYYSDPTHRNVFGLYTFSYLAAGGPLRRQVPRYIETPGLVLARVDLRFKSDLPFYGRHAIRKTIGWIFNSSRYMQELYEENLCWMFPCYEIRYELRRTGA